MLDRRERARAVSPHGRERGRRLALPLEVLKIANGAAEPRAAGQLAAARGPGRRAPRLYLMLCLSAVGQHRLSAMHARREHDMAPEDGARPPAADAAVAARRAPTRACALPLCATDPTGADTVGLRGRGSVFARLGQAAHDEEAHTGRKSVFDRIKGAPTELAGCCQVLLPGAGVW